MLQVFLFAFLLTLINCESHDERFERLFGPQDTGRSGQTRIVGGENSPVHYPYQISLQMLSRGGGGFFFFQQPSSNW